MEVLQIWFMHRRVCGDRSNPFRWPSFSDKEIDEMVDLSNQPLQLGSSPSYTWFDKYGDEKGLPKLEGYRRFKFKVRCIRTSSRRGEAEGVV